MFRHQIGESRLRRCVLGFRQILAVHRPNEIDASLEYFMRTRIYTVRNLSTRLEKKTTGDKEGTNYVQKS
jgi:hypothetical protein